MRGGGSTAWLGAGEGQSLMARSTLTAPMLERQLVQLRDELVRTKRDLLAAREGAVQVPVITPGQLAEIRAVANQLSAAADCARAIADSVARWEVQTARVAAALDRRASETSPTT
jgi:hypothetical protein